MATLPEGREPLTDGDMIMLLHNMAISLSTRDETLSADLRSTADRLSELSKAERTAQHKAIQG